MPRIYRRIIRLHSRPGHHLPQQVLLLFLSLYYDSTKIVQLILSKSLRSSWNTAVDVAIRLLMAVGPWIPFRYRPDNFLHPQSPDWLWSPPRLLFDGYRSSYLEAKRPEPDVNYSRPSSTKKRKDWTIPLWPSCVFTLWTGETFSTLSYFNIT